MPKFEHHVFICTNVREPGNPRGSCTTDGKGELFPLFAAAIKDKGLKGKVRQQKSNCMDQCEHGPMVVVYPDAVWYGGVQPGDVAEIVEQHLIGGRPVARLIVPDECLNAEKCAHKPRPASAAPPPAEVVTPEAEVVASPS